MKKQRNHSKLREEKSPERTTNEIDISSILHPELKKEVIKMLQELRKIMDRNAGHCNKELETIKRNQSKLDNSIAEINTDVKAMNSRLTKAEEWISDMEDRIMEITQSEQQTERQKTLKWHSKKKITGQYLWWI